MASLATFAAVQTPGTIKGLREAQSPGLENQNHQKTKSGAVVAKYCDKSVYLYGSDAPSPYNSLQVIVYSRANSSFTKRGLLLKFLILGGGLTLAYFSSTATGDIFPIKKGPQLPPKLGPRGKI